jgi:hypothetical protein
LKSLLLNELLTWFAENRGTQENAIHLKWVNPAALKLGGRDPFKCHQIFLKSHQCLPGLSYYLRFVVVYNILGSQNFKNVFERVAIQKSLRTPGLAPITFSKTQHYRVIKK